MIKRKFLLIFLQLVLKKNFISNWGFLIQIQTVSDIIESQGLNYIEGIKLNFYNFNSGNDGAITAIKNKRFYDVVRPPTAMQCLYGGQTITSWLGPYQGCGSMPGEEWKAWHPNVNNGSPEYPCEHCVNFGVVGQVLTNFFGSDRYLGRNITVGEGTYLVEKKITVGNPGYVAGVTDVPNTGPNSVGYAPATDMQLSWSTNQQFSRDCAISRIHYGVHTFHSGWVGENAGKEIANRGWKIASALFEGKRQCKELGVDY